MCTTWAIDFADPCDTVGKKLKLRNISRLERSAVQHITEFGRDCSRNICILDPDRLYKMQNNKQ